MSISSYLHMRFDLPDIGASRREFPELGPLPDHYARRCHRGVKFTLSERSPFHTQKTEGKEK